ncbi:MAG: hypothetical protein H0U75_13600 [Legionella sp.]|nr:hypothetical protein [Legionella sp.]
MNFKNKLSVQGDHPLLLEGVVGNLEAVLTVPDQRPCNQVAILGHPHSLQGGTMTNKVVTTMARTFKEMGIPSLRFNFRGVGLSSGTYDDGIGESEDMLKLAGDWLQAEPQAHFIFAGFSFGSYVAYRAAAQMHHKLLISIAPPVHHYDYNEFQPAPKPWVIVQGDADEVVPEALVMQFAQTFDPPLPVIHFPHTGHFFHGKLVELKAQLTECIQTLDD